MAKGQKRSNRESKKPKKAASLTPAASSASPFSAPRVFGKRQQGGAPKK